MRPGRPASSHRCTDGRDDAGTLVNASSADGISDSSAADRYARSSDCNCRATMTGPSAVPPTATSTAVPPTATIPPTKTTTVAVPTSAPAAAANATPATSTVPSTGAKLEAYPKDACLACHGPFDKLTAATAKYAVGAVIRLQARTVMCAQLEGHQGHTRVLLLATKHTRFAGPATGSPKANGDWCLGCHHAEVLECGTCVTTSEGTGDGGTRLDAVQERRA